MPEFNSQTDIGNRALQHVGATLMGTLGFAESTKQARQVSFCYGKLRQAELRENVWTFATRRVALRPIDPNTMLLVPALWVSTTTYFRASIVADQNGVPWSSRIPNNLGFQPLTSPNVWEPYFGPQTVSLYDSTQAYYSGELAYTAAGDGTYNVYVSLYNGNPIHPALPNQWAIGTAYYKNQVVQVFPAWAVGTTYTKGQGVLYTDGNVYASLTNGNVGNTPSSSATNWAMMPVLKLATPTVPASGVQPTLAPTTSPVLEWSSGTTYSQGAFVMFNGTEYLSLVNTNTGNYPNAAGSTSWVAVTNGTLYMSLIDLNIGNNPSNAPALWSSGTTYASGIQVGGSDGVIYTSKINGNIGHDPTIDATHTFWTNTGVLLPWTSVFTQGGGNDYWLQIGGASFPNGVSLQTIDIQKYPVGSGPATQVSTRNIYRLPAGFMRKAPQDPKGGSVSFLGAPGNAMYLDWLYEGGYLITWMSNPILLRFVADVVDVTRMDPLFCEALAAKIGEEVCEGLTQSTVKVQVCTKAYDQAVFKAKQQNAIEEGAEEAPLDDFIACRA